MAIRTTLTTDGAVLVMTIAGAILAAVTDGLTPHIGLIRPAAAPSSVIIFGSRRRLIGCGTSRVTKWRDQVLAGGVAGRGCEVRRCWS